MLSYAKPILDSSGEPVNRVLDFEKIDKVATKGNEFTQKSSSENGPSEVSHSGGENLPAKAPLGPCNSASSRTNSW